jgi:hypothetical protein
MQGPKQRLTEGEKKRCFRKAQGSTGSKGLLYLDLYILHSEHSLAKPKVAILVPNSPKASEAIQGSDYETVLSCFWGCWSPGWSPTAPHHLPSEAGNGHVCKRNKGTEKSDFQKAV